MSILVMLGFFFILALATYGGCSIIAWIAEKIIAFKNKSR